MSARLNYFQASPKAMGLMMEMEKYIANCYRERKTLTKELTELIKIRVSQMNGCAYCLDMHTKNSEAIDMSSERINLVSVYKDAHCYSKSEKLALRWTEVNTNISKEEIDDVFFEEMKSEFTDEQIVDLTIVVNAINAWNRFGVSFKEEAGVYKAGDFDI
jgi:AhpD family alkylhydroperoxidase